MTRWFVLAAMTVLVAGCANNKTPPSTTDENSVPTTQPATQASSSAQPINKYCAVDRDDPVDPKVTYLYQGKVIGFCCEDCIPKFKKDPEKYMKDLK